MNSPSPLGTRDVWLRTGADIAALVARDRLCPVLVRYRGVSEGRFTAPAQDVADLVEMLEATGRYVRDASYSMRADGPADCPCLFADGPRHAGCEGA